MAQDKAARILDAAEALLLNLGYRKVTVDDVARRAGVGKGTMYLYWPSKQELFGAVLGRDAARLLADQIAGLRADPGQVRLHRAFRGTFLQVMRRPLAKALYTGDHAVFAGLLQDSAIGRQLAVGKIESTAAYLALLHSHGLLLDDPAADPLLAYRVSAVVSGFFLVEGISGGHLDAVDVTAKADALATTLRRAFEPVREPAQKKLRAAADSLIELNQSWLDQLLASLPIPNME